MNDNLKEKISLMPDSPGCYIYKDIDGNVLYVGKAKRLKTRVNQYFDRVYFNKTANLVKQIEDVEFVFDEHVFIEGGIFFNFELGTDSLTLYSTFTRAVCLITFRFAVNNKLIDILSVLETVNNGCTQEVSIPPETSYVRLVLRRVDNEYYSRKIVAEYSVFSYCLCAIVVAVATLVESFIVYFLAKDILISGLRLRMTLIGVGGMFFMAILISLIVAGLTVLAYRRNCKKVINK